MKYLIILYVITVGMFTYITIDLENGIEKLYQDMDSKDSYMDSLNCTIDSLYLEIDTLIWDSQIWDQNIINSATHLLSAIIHVESSNNDSAYHKGEDAVGCLQIRQTMVDDVNRILRRQGEIKRFHYEDRWCRAKSIQMFDIYRKHYNLNSAEEIARCWNGGPRGINKSATAGYWEKVKNKIEENS